MKKIFYYILMGAFLLGTATSCEDSVEDLSKVTYFAELNLKGDDFVKLSLGETYTEPGPGIEPMYDFHAEAKLKLNADNTLTLIKVGNWYFASELALSLTEGKYNPETGVVTMTVDY